MKGEKIFTLSTIAILISISFISIVEVRAVENSLSLRINEKLDRFQSRFPRIQRKTEQDLPDNFKQLFFKFNQIEKISDLKEKQFSKLNVFLSNIASNFSSLDVIGALFGSLIFLLITQPLVLQFIVETGIQPLFIVILVSLLLIESFQKLFFLKIIGIWEQYIKNDVDGLWNFFSIVFFTSYVKIYLSYLPTFIIQYSNIPTKVFFYAFMFSIPILFNVCIADSIDMIDWNGDEIPITT